MSCRTSGGCLVRLACDSIQDDPSTKQVILPPGSGQPGVQRYPGDSLQCRKTDRVSMGLPGACTRSKEGIMGKFPEKFPADAFTLENYALSSVSLSHWTDGRCWKQETFGFLSCAKPVRSRSHRFGPIRSSSAEQYVLIFRSLTLHFRISM